MSDDAPTTDAEAHLSALADRIADAEARLAAAEAVDLAGLDALTERACSAVAALPAEQRDVLRPRAEALLAGLDRLAGALHGQAGTRDGHHTEAARAYARGAATERGEP
ncbi:hypothetical protein SAMN05216241_103256 [Limimonas halophila]|uniref:Uncharacterized protein n=1 Tax=Limimonas halophila TaxID=1082479 RepID=A0A1G7Q6P5_9PROT|nr:hypothetical protein [Limimonas halophila]SDF94143.1 hypothetical protein SAMN05216241_103256 [Limimonas halophila]